MPKYLLGNPKDSIFYDGRPSFFEKRKRSKPFLSVSVLALSIVIAIPQDIEAARSGPLFGDDIRTARSAWFGPYQGIYDWQDSGAGSRQALRGVSFSEPGIALPDRKTLGHWFEVELNGRIFVVRHTDIGPARWTGRGIDINSALADMAGYSPRTFPTNSRVRFRYIGPKKTREEKAAIPPQPKPLSKPDVTKTTAHKPSEVYELAAPLVLPPINLFSIEESDGEDEREGVQPFFGFDYLEQEKKSEELPPSQIKPKIEGGYPRGLHPVIKESMLEASKYLPVGYKIRFLNAARNNSRVGRHSYHIKRDRFGALAADISIINPQGQAMRNIRAPDNFKIYQTFMQNVKKVQFDRFPAYRGRGRWGGYFVFGVSQDLMHYDLGPENGTAAGNWAQGLKPRYAHFGRKGDVGKGMGKISTFKLPSIYTTPNSSKNVTITKKD